MKNSKLSFLYPILMVLFVVIIIYILVIMYNSYFKPKQNFSNIELYGNKKFKSSSKFADVEFTTSQDAQTLYITVNYKDLTGVSAIHIHTNNNGSPGPILAWLGTSHEWQHGVAQNTPGSNAPCCTEDNPLCTLAAPKSTPYVNNLSNTTRTFTVTNKTCKGCPWIENGTLLDVHGFNFQKVLNGQLSTEKPGADMISNTLFELVN